MLELDTGNNHSLYFQSKTLLDFILNFHECARIVKKTILPTPLSVTERLGWETVVKTMSPMGPECCSSLWRFCRRTTKLSLLWLNKFTFLNLVQDVGKVRGSCSQCLPEPNWNSQQNQGTITLNYYLETIRRGDFEPSMAEATSRLVGRAELGEGLAPLPLASWPRLRLWRDIYLQEVPPERHEAYTPDQPPQP